MIAGEMFETWSPSLHIAAIMDIVVDFPQRISGLMSDNLGNIWNAFIP